MVFKRLPLRLLCLLIAEGGEQLLCLVLLMFFLLFSCAREEAAETEPEGRAPVQGGLSANLQWEAAGGRPEGGRRATCRDLGGCGLERVSPAASNCACPNPALQQVVLHLGTYLVHPLPCYILASGTTGLL